MSGYNIGDLPFPKARRRVDKAAARRKGKGRFESIREAEDQERRRARSVRNAVRRFPQLLDVERAEVLASILEASADRKWVPSSLASSVCMRWHRIRVIGALCKLVMSGKRVTTATIIPRTWEFTPEQLMQVDPRLLLKAFRSDLYRKGAARQRGWLFAFIHGEFDPGARVFRLHLHILCRKEMVPLLDRLRALPNYRSTRTLPNGEVSPVYRRVFIRRKPLFNLPDPLTYVMQSFWPSRPIYIDKDGKRKRVRQKRAIPEPYHAMVLLWLDRWQLKDLTLMVGLRVTRRGLRKTRRNR